MWKGDVLVVTVGLLGVRCIGADQGEGYRYLQ
jgi:hypothetical protein